MIKSFFFALFLSFKLSAAVTIPEFVPNVVDQAGQLKPSEVQQVNESLLQIRNRSDIWGAVYLLQTLNGESLEAVAEKAFKKWKLGDGKRDNGLLLVLVLGERKSRFEVGYGLEGDLPDIIVLQALNEKLRPLMRSGQTAAAIISAFDFLADVKTKINKKPDANAKTVNTANRVTTPFGGSTGNGSHAVSGDREAMVAKVKAMAEERLLQRYQEQQKAVLMPLDEPNKPENFGFWSWLVFTLTLFLTGPIGYLLLKKEGDSAAELYPQYKIDIARNLLNERFKLTSMRSIGIKIFLMINPGVFIYSFANQIKELTYVFCGFSALYFLMALKLKTRNFSSQEGVKSFLNTLKTKSDGLLKKKHIRLNELGNYEYNDSYFSSQDYRNTTSIGGSSSSSGSSGSSSSSGGGSSGGGGASSSW